MQKSRTPFILSALSCLMLSACDQNESPEIPQVDQKRTVEKIGDLPDLVVPEIAKPVISGKFTPPDDKLLMFIGQDSETVTEYVNNMPEDNMEGITLYTRISGDKIGNDWTGSLPALYGASDWGAGVVDFKKSLAESPNAALAVGLFLSDTANGEARCQSKYTKAIASGEYDHIVDNMVNYFKDLAPRRVFLRIGYEYDGPWNCYKPEPYKAAFRYIAERIDTLEAENVVTVWQSAVWPAHDEKNPEEAVYDHRREDILDLWYPGDDVVDWMGVSVFYRDLTQWNYVPLYTPAAAQERFLKFARKHKKPVLIAEAAPQGYSIGELTHSFTQLNNPIDITAEQIWDAWYATFFGFVYSNRDVVRGVAYINANWKTQNMWRCDYSETRNFEICPSGNWGDSRVHANPLIKERWLEQINNADIWVQSSDYE